MKRLPLLAQGLYFLATGLWPFVHLPSFLAVTGPKQDIWLVKTVGVLVSVVGAVLLLAGLRRRSPGGEIGLLAAGSALGLAAVDVTYVARGRISPVYLLDAAAEVAVTGLWARAAAQQRRQAALYLGEGI